MRRKPLARRKADLITILKGVKSRKKDVISKGAHPDLPGNIGKELRKAGLELRRINSITSRKRSVRMLAASLGLAKTATELEVFEVFSRRLISTFPKVVWIGDIYPENANTHNLRDHLELQLAATGDLYATPIARMPRGKNQPRYLIEKGHAKRMFEAAISGVSEKAHARAQKIHAPGILTRAKRNVLSAAKKRKKLFGKRKE